MRSKFEAIGTAYDFDPNLYPSYRVAGRKLARFITSIDPVRRALRYATRALPKWIWERLPVDDTFEVSLPGEHSIIRYRSCGQDLIGRALFWRGLESWESGTIRTFLQLARRSSFFMDIGANSGVYTLLACASNPALTAMSFEPVPHIYQRLCENIRLNGWESRCQAFNMAVSNYKGVADFHIPYVDFPSSASLNPSGFRQAPGALIKVDTTTIDFLSDQTKQVDLLKIDVEGFEDKVLEGMRNVLKAWQPAMIIECIPDGPYKRIERVLKAHGYRFFHLRESGPVSMTEIMPDFVEVNYAFLPENRLGWLA